MRALLVAAGSLLFVCLLGCGGADHGTVVTQSRPTSVKRCLEAKGLKVTGGPGRPIAGDTDAPDRGELITEGAFIGFYSSQARAQKLAPKLQASAARHGGTLARRGNVSVLYLNREAHREIDACLPP
jgi:hypothetical protein